MTRAKRNPFENFKHLKSKLSNSAHLLRHCKWILFGILTTCTSQIVLAGNCDFSVNYIATDTIEAFNESKEVSIELKPNSSYFRLVNSDNKVLQDNL